MGKTQRSKRARQARKEAGFAGMWRNMGHPSHVSRNMKSAARVACLKDIRREARHA